MDKSGPQHRVTDPELEELGGGFDAVDPDSAIQTDHEQPYSFNCKTTTETLGSQTEDATRVWAHIYNTPNQQNIPENPEGPNALLFKQGVLVNDTWEFSSAHNNGLDAQPQQAQNAPANNTHTLVLFAKYEFPDPNPNDPPEETAIAYTRSIILFKFWKQFGP